jgi:NAD(P)-dependent dehydrogenase (short-subunit alcohol dehydrogenase family)
MSAKMGQSLSFPVLVDCAAARVLGAYCISKAADLQLVRNLAVENGQHNVRVNAISPAWCVQILPGRFGKIRMFSRSERQVIR